MIINHKCIYTSETITDEKAEPLEQKFWLDTKLASKLVAYYGENH